MPIRRGYTTKGGYYQFGKGGKRYFYKPSNKQSRLIALAKAKRQGRAIAVTKYG